MRALAVLRSPQSIEEFSAGQKWRYSTRPNEENSTLVILKVEEYEGVGEVVHIAVDGLLIRNTEKPESPHSDISHMPFVAEAVRKCVTELVGYVKVPDVSEGYECWRDCKMAEYWPKDFLTKLLTASRRPPIILVRIGKVINKGHFQHHRQAIVSLCHISRGHQFLSSVFTRPATTCLR